MNGSRSPGKLRVSINQRGRPLNAAFVVRQPQLHLLLQIPPVVRDPWIGLLRSTRVAVEGCTLWHKVVCFRWTTELRSNKMALLISWLGVEVILVVLIEGSVGREVDAVVRVKMALEDVRLKGFHATTNTDDDLLDGIGWIMGVREDGVGASWINHTNAP